MTYKKTFIIFILCFFFSPLLQADENQYKEALKNFSSIALLDQGRVKPIDTFARESVFQITGKTSYQGKSPVEVILNWLNHPENAYHASNLLSKYKALNQKLSLRVENDFVSAQNLIENPELNNLLKEIQAKQSSETKLTALEKEALELLKRLEIFNKICTGSFLNIYPSLHPTTKLDQWQNPLQADAATTAPLKSFLVAYDQSSADLLNLSESLKSQLKEMGKSISTFPSDKEINREIHFNKLRPFQKAWIAFVISLILFTLSSFSLNTFFRKICNNLAYLFNVSGFVFCIYGLVTRCLIAGRPPVSNMYESLLWVSFTVLFFAYLLFAFYKNKILIYVASFLAFFGLLLADLLPNVLSPSIQPLVPVLRSNYWLTIHVLTITLSYAAFALSMGLGHLSLFYLSFKKNPEKLKKIKLLNYRAMQIGVVLIAAGTILGGVWAADSWGRFWGWDPKEVWALITLLGYLAILHGRYSGWMNDLTFTMSSIIAFLLVVMAWYGVNFVLGVGLHSYGFSTGGFKWVIAFVGLQFIYLVGIYFMNRNAKLLQ